MDHSVMFVYNKESMSNGLTKFTDVSKDVLLQTSTMFDITLNVTEEAGGLSISAIFDAKKFSFSFMEGSSSLISYSSNK